MFYTYSLSGKYLELLSCVLNAGERITNQIDKKPRDD